METTMGSTSASSSEDKRTVRERMWGGCYALPWCTLILVGLSITCHSLVLVGNLDTAQTFATLGHSTGGWSDVGINVANTLVSEIEHDMSKTTHMLTKALGLTLEVEKAIDLFMGQTGNHTHKAVKTYMEKISKPYKTHETEILAKGDVKGANHNVELDGAASEKPLSKKDYDDLKSSVKAEVSVLIGDVKKALHSFFEMIKPALLQIGKWLHSMGAKMQGFIEQFSTTLDRVQKIFDQVMSKVAGGSKAGLKDKLLYHTFNIMDISHTGSIGVQDIEDVAHTYNIAALAGAKGRQLHKKYDADNDGQLSKAEYAKMVEDKSLPSVMSYSLRSFAKKLSQIAGVLKGARKRDEVADSLADYLILMTCKNLTKVGWVSETLTNNSLPIDLSIDVFKKLAEKEKAPDRLTDLPSAQIITTEMMRLNPEHVANIVQKMQDPARWASQGWDAMEQPKIVYQVLGWVAKATDKLSNEHKKLFMTSFLEEGAVIHPEGSDEDLEVLSDVAVKKVLKDQKKYQHEHLQERIRKHSEVFYAESTADYYKLLLGSDTMASGSDDPDVTAAIKGGVLAAPETLKFAKFLVNNATATSHRFQKYCFDYAKTSSNAIDSFANGVQALVKKVQNFLNLMMKYATKRGVEDLEKKLQQFAEDAMADVGQVADHLVDKIISKNHKLLNGLHRVDEAGDEIDAAGAAAKGMLDLELDAEHKKVVVANKLQLSGVWKQVVGILKQMKSILPTVVKDIKFAQKEVSMVSSTLHSIFTVFKAKGSPIFIDVSSLYRTVWIAYFLLFVSLMLVILYYAFWAEGYFGGPKPDPSVEVPPPPAGCYAKCCQCISCCCGCLRSCQDSHLCMWACVLLSEIVILLLFVVSIVFAILAGLKAFISMGCAQIYLLGDDTICTSILSGLRDFMETFWLEMPQGLSHACVQRQLPACKVIQNAMMSSAIFTVAGSFAATIFTMQLIFQAAHLHEKALWNNKFKKLYED